MPIEPYIQNIARRYALGNATEHTFRGDLQRLIEELVAEVAATNEPKRIECGAPDYVITRKDIPVGYIEAKDVGVDLDGKGLKEQFDRYRNALDNLVFTDYLDFHFYINGDRTASIRIAEIRGGKIVALPETFEQFTSLIKEFCSRTPQSIKSSKKLAEMMAEKAKILAFIIKNAIEEDIATGAVTDLTNQMKAFKDILIHDIDPKSFADIYAQTIAYGMFAARLHDKDLETFSRQEAAAKIPKTNPFLRKLFQFIAAFDLDTRIDWIVDALADLFRATDIAAILKNFGKSTQTHDPIMHFYEIFLAEYDPKLRKSRGVFYTPEPVVDFIVRAVDDILKTEFDLPNGLADTSKTTIKVKTPVIAKKGKGTVYKDVDQEVHKVQILDPATGTGTFLATVIKHIYKGFANQQGVWSQYVDQHLIPRLNGFELLMASYAMAHLKLDLLLTETGYKSEPGATATGSPQRFQVYLTNALEEYHPDTGTLFANWLSTEANEANYIKRDTPVMVVIGNPPYSVSSSNKSEWIEQLMVDYKKDLDERNINPLSDDYLKFLRFGEHFIEKNGVGILSYITNNSFVSGVIHRQVRKKLLETFNAIYILNLHGNSAQQERSPDGSPDENVFDIQQGVSINIFVKSGSFIKDGAKRINYCDLFGTRQSKYDRLHTSTLDSVEWNSIVPQSPDYFFFPLDHLIGDKYKTGFSAEDIFIIGASGIKTERDSLVIQFSESELAAMKTDLIASDVEEFRSRHREKPDGRDWKIGLAKKDLVENAPVTATKIQYRPFDVRFTYYTGRIKGIHAYPRGATMKHMASGNNFALLVGRQNKSGTVDSVFITKLISEMKSSERTIQSYHFPLYVRDDINIQPLLGEQSSESERVPNLNSEIVNKIAAAIGLTFVAEKGGNPSGSEGVSSANIENAAGNDTLPTGRVSDLDATFAPIDILDYIYAVLHSPSYREKYKEFLKIDFPRVPYPKDAATFWELVKLGGELRQIHLLESPTVSKFITGYPGSGNNVVEKPEFKNPVAIAPGSDTRTVGDVFINATQYFSGVPAIAWNFYIGGYQPAQKWLKDRKGRTLSYDDIQHYQKIIVALVETDRLMKLIDEGNFLNT